jgi:hypothetical protein
MHVLLEFVKNDMTDLQLSEVASIFLPQLLIVLKDSDNVRLVYIAHNTLLLTAHIKRYSSGTFEVMRHWFFAIVSRWCSICRKSL